MTDVIYVILVLLSGWFLAAAWEEHDKRKRERWYRKHQEEEARMAIKEPTPITKPACMLEAGDKLEDNRVVKDVYFENKEFPVRVMYSDGNEVGYTTDRKMILHQEMRNRC